MFQISLVVAFAGLLVAWLVLLKHPITFAVAAVFVGALSDVTGIGQSGIQLGVTVYPGDLSCAALISSCVVVALRTRSSPRDFCRPALMLIGLGVLNFGRGSMLFGLKSAGNDTRDLIYLVLPLVAFSMLGNVIRLNAERIAAYLSFASLAFAAIAVGRWVGVLPMPDVWDEEFREIVRVLPSDYAMIVGQALIGVLGLQLVRGFRPVGFLLAGGFAALVFALQHRSVWFATAAGLVWLIMRLPRPARREWLQLTSLTLLVATAITLAALIAAGPLENALKLLGSNVDEVTQADSTWAWRMDGYTEAIQRVLSSSPGDMTFGPPSGQDLSMKAGFASIHIHDRYIQIFAYYGVAGLAVLIACLASITLRTERLSPRNPFEKMDKAILEAILVSTVIYFVPYAGGQLQGTLLGAVWLASATRRVAGESRVSQTRVDSPPEVYEIKSMPARF